MAISITFMRYYCAVIEQGGISRAAAELNVAASAVASAIDLVEDHFSLTLLNRFRSRGVQPTKSGKEIYEQFTNLIEEYEHVMQSASELRDGLSGHINIGYYAPVAPAFLPRIIKELREKHSIHVQLTECDNDAVQERYLAGEFDIIFFVSNTSLLQIPSEILLEAPAYCLLPWAHPLTENTLVKLDELRNETIIVLNRPTAAEYYKNLFSTIGQIEADIIYANSTEMVRSLVGAGVGYAVLNMIPATDISYAGDKVVALPIDRSVQSLHLSIGYDIKKPRRLVKAFVNLCKKHIHEQALTVNLKSNS